MFVNPTSAFPGRPSPRRIDFGSAWYARWANESPSTTRSGRVTRATSRARDRLLEPIGRGAGSLRRSEPVEVVDFHRRAVGHTQRAEPCEPLRARDPGRDERNARLERDPCRAGVPAGLVALPQALPAPRPLREHDDRMALPAELDRGADRLFVPLAATDPEAAPAVTIAPSGNQKSSDFAMKRRKRRGKSGIPSGHGSKFDQWFAASTSPPSRGTFSTPVARSRKTPLTSGQLTVATTK